MPLLYPIIAGVATEMKDDMLSYKDSTDKEAIVAEYRELDSVTYADAMKQLNPGETLVAANVAPGKPEKGNIPVTSDRSFRIQAEMGRNTFHARKG